MPLYEYRCVDCDHQFEVIQKFSDPPVDKCPKCGGPVRKLMSSPAIQFKGSGWYITDYARKGSTGGGESKSESGGAADSSAKSDSTTKSEKSEKSDKSEKPASASSSESGGKSSASPKPAADPVK